MTCLSSLLLLLTVVALLLPLAAAKPNQQIDRIWKARRTACERAQPCASRPTDENQNCVMKCVSESCFEQIYGLAPLEDGEVDSDRLHRFNNCVRKEEREKKKSRASAL